MNDQEELPETVQCPECDALQKGMNDMLKVNICEFCNHMWAELPLPIDPGKINIITGPFDRNGKFHTRINVTAETVVYIDEVGNINVLERYALRWLREGFENWIWTEQRNRYQKMIVIIETNQPADHLDSRIFNVIDFS